MLAVDGQQLMVDGEHGLILIYDVAIRSSQWEWDGAVVGLQVGAMGAYGCQ